MLPPGRPCKTYLFKSFARTPCMCRALLIIVKKPTNISLIFRISMIMAISISLMISISPILIQHYDRFQTFFLQTRLWRGALSANFVWSWYNIPSSGECGSRSSPSCSGENLKIFHREGELCNPVEDEDDEEEEIDEEVDDGDEKEWHLLLMREATSIFAKSPLLLSRPC